MIKYEFYHDGICIVHLPHPNPLYTGAVKSIFGCPFPLFLPVCSRLSFFPNCKKVLGVGFTSNVKLFPSELFSVSLVARIFSIIFIPSYWVEPV